MKQVFVFLFVLFSLHFAMHRLNNPKFRLPYLEFYNGKIEYFHKGIITVSNFPNYKNIKLHREQDEKCTNKLRLIIS